MAEVSRSRDQADDKTRWLPLGDACRLLAVNQATLRQWADGGYLRVYRTPGGHRRFLRDDLETFFEGVPPGSDSEREETLEGLALRRIRRRLHQESVARQPWYQSIEAEGRTRMRLFGRRLLSLLAQQGANRPRRREDLAEFYLLGHEHGAEMAWRRLPLKDAIEAFVFFRTLVLHSADPDSWGRILELADRVLVGVVGAYQDRMPPPRPERQP